MIHAWFGSVPISLMGHLLQATAPIAELLRSGYAEMCKVTPRLLRAARRWELMRTLSTAPATLQTQASQL